MTSEPTTTEATAPHASEAGLDAAYVQHLLGLQRTVRLTTLAAGLGNDAVYRVEGLGDGLTTVAFRTSQVDPETLRALLGFRLAEFLNLGMMSASLARGLNLLHEPVEGTENNIHAVCLDETGRILGYLALVGAALPERSPLDDPGREMFPVEVAHHVDLVSRFAHTGITTHHTWEIKRFVRASGQPHGSRRDRVPWHLILAMGRTAVSLDEVRLLIGDSRKDGALRHLGLIGFDPVTLPHTQPSLPRDYLMWPSYEREVTARPFASLLPDSLGSYLDIVDGLLRRQHGDGWQKQLMLKLLTMHATRAAGKCSDGKPVPGREEVANAIPA